MILILEKNEYTIQMMCEKMNRHFGGKINGQPFNTHDIKSYMKLGKLPDIYGGNRIKWMRKYGFTAITVLKREDCESYRPPSKDGSLDNETSTSTTGTMGRRKLPAEQRLKRKSPKARKGSKRWRRQGIIRRRLKYLRELEEKAAERKRSGDAKP